MHTLALIGTIIAFAGLIESAIATCEAYTLWRYSASSVLSKIAWAHLVRSVLRTITLVAFTMVGYIYVTRESANYSLVPHIVIGVAIIVGTGFYDRWVAMQFKADEEITK